MFEIIIVFTILNVLVEEFQGNTINDNQERTQWSDYKE